ncbi:MAG TPA: DUF4349 domain-containing protein [Baekduia sp.]|jgi:hypothetical protein|nr:DUF4349 domain-containing protein [Baekduia sp.]
MRRRNALPGPEADRGLREIEAALAHDPTADPDLAMLVADLDAVRPEPDANFLASLDARVHAGFPTERGTPRRPRGARAAPAPARVRRQQRLALGLSAALAAGVAVVVIATSSGGGDSASLSSRPSTVLAPSDDSASSASSASTSAGRPAVGAGAAAPSQRPAVETSTSSSSKAATTPRVPLPTPLGPSAPRKVQRDASLTLTPAIADVQNTADGVVRETQAAAGYVQRSQVATQDDGGTASFTLRIPSARLDDALARLSKLAHVGALTQASTDITATTASAADRLKDARDERQALLRALGRATTDRQIASLKARLADNRSQIAARQGALDAVRRRADLATVDVTVQGTDRPSSGGGGGGAWTPRDALHDAGRVLEVAGGVALIALAVLAPPAVLAALAWLGARGVRRRRRETALDRTA